ncbi:hypothetical protein [Streptomyces aureocirculatus]|uniref:hypothetical protein n=1 Tax=Streptomyces aureocirculatus TaxID=67275 RepID=UPI0004C94CF8|nr:hypothetical protein [Streptomyces aureocirculatus]
MVGRVPPAVDPRRGSLRSPYAQKSVRESVCAEVRTRDVVEDRRSRGEPAQDTPGRVARSALVKEQGLAEQPEPVERLHDRLRLGLDASRPDRPTERLTASVISRTIGFAPLAPMKYELAGAFSSAST